MKVLARCKARAMLLTGIEPGYPIAACREDLQSRQTSSHLRASCGYWRVTASELFNLVCRVVTRPSVIVGIRLVAAVAITDPVDPNRTLNEVTFIGHKLPRFPALERPLGFL